MTTALLMLVTALCPPLVVVTLPVVLFLSLKQGDFE